jgi:ribose 5-phosphate isomerase B
MEIALGADHAGFVLKERMKRELEAMGHRVVDVGTVYDETDDYPDFAAQVGRMVAEGQVQRGVLLCGTGTGMAIAANKVRGVRAAAVNSAEEARLSRLHNDANVLALGARFIGEEDAAAVLRAWMEAEFEGGRHQRRVNKILELERNSR